MESTLPRLRTDLIRRRQTTAEGVVYIIKDPVRGEFFRLREAEGYIAEQLDDGVTLDDLREKVQARFNAELRRDVLSGFLKKLERRGLLETERGADVRQRQHRKLLAGSALYFRIRLFDPERLFNRLIRYTRFFYTIPFAYISAAVILVAIVISLSNWHEIAADGAGMYRFSTLPLLLGTVFLVGTAHEFSHGLTCKYFGGEVRDMGFLMLYFQPALYCNVSDAWLFPEKYKRLLVGFAGPYFELFLGGVATILWRLTDEDTFISHFSLLVMASAGVKTLLNFDPLIKLDGYYLLSDYLEIPNLRRRSFAYVGDVLRRISGKLERLPEVTARQRRIFLAYGLSGLGGSVIVFTYTSLLIGRYLVVNEQQVMFFLFSGLVGIRYRQYFNRLFGHVAKTRDKRIERIRQLVRFKRSTIAKLILAGAAVLLLFEAHMDLTVAGPIAMLPERNADVRTQVAGIVAEVLVHEGEHVKKGQVIAKLDDRDQTAALQQTIATIRQKRALLQQLIAGPTQDQIAVERQSVATLKDQLSFAEAKATRVKALYQRHVVSRDAYDTAVGAEADASNKLAEEQNKLKVLLDGTPPEQIRAAKAELTGLEARRDYLQEQLKSVNVTTPASGVVTTPTRQLVELADQSVKEGGLIAKVYNVDEMVVQTAISEKDIGVVHIGQKIAVKVRAYPGRTFYGLVTEIGTTTAGDTSQPDNAVPGSVSGSGSGSAAGKSGANVVVTTKIDNRKHLLKPGMTGMAKIYCGKRSMIDLILRHLSRTVRVEFWSWW